MNTQELAFELHDFIEKLNIDEETKIKIHIKIIDTILKLLVINMINKEDEHND